MMTGHGRDASERPARLETVDAREHQVDQDQLGRLGREVGDGILAAPHVVDRVALVLERQAHRGTDPLVVLDDQDAAHGPIMTRPPRPERAGRSSGLRSAAGTGGYDSQICWGQMAPPIRPKALAPAGVVGLLKFCTFGWAPMAHTVRAYQT